LRRHKPALERPTKKLAGPSDAEARRHGYALANRDIFHPRGAARDWEMIFAMFHRQIPPDQSR
jgi:hypothetical protein